jgi:hypothetical protein
MCKTFQRTKNQGGNGTSDVVLLQNYLELYPENKDKQKVGLVMDRVYKRYTQPQSEVWKVAKFRKASLNRLLQVTAIAGHNKELPSS